ncbi:IS200/IS605 family transposase OrfB [Candidatus Mancarchaeum acidiphilum]|uniref:IS200/IS605 family transposase OrfB n=1 Tax=Candidatus Mancarchaeum acidiphilum TaxID=1920749 RepID=A0A218NMP0_9ARCH|nr:RNA-guided endonuclease TnpB family protein [Candidatus Mancarchaeum acidiphilum]ASI13732.1 IS200/IS605 family transposase OrfB [Candidatus Mancarchaeum acidiphilum]
MNGYTNNMDSTRAYKFRIYPDTKRQNEIDERLILAQQFYNRILEKSIESYKNGEAKASMAQFNRFVKEVIQDDKRYLKLYSQTRCEIEYRLLKAYQNFFRRIKEGNKEAGFPRFKSITYPQDNGSFSIKRGRLRVSRIGTMRIELHRKIEGTIKTLSIKREGKDYYAIFTTANEIKIPQLDDTNPVGIDMGLHSFIAMSSGMKMEKPRFVRKRAKHLARWQRRIAKREKGSKRRENAKNHLQKEWEHVTEQSDDFSHKLSNKLVNSGYTSFAVEDLHIQKMAKNHNLAQAIYNASWNKFIQMLSYKAESAGMKVIKVDSRDTTQECSNCHHIKEGSERLTLGDRLYRCNVCGLTIDRDINASINILKRATLGQRGSHAQGESVRPQREAVLEELRTDKTHPLQDAVIA